MLIIMANLHITEMHQCEYDAFQQAETEGIIDSTSRFTDDKKKYQPYCLFSYQANGNVQHHYPIDLLRNKRGI